MIRSWESFLKPGYLENPDAVSDELKEIDGEIPNAPQYLSRILEEFDKKFQSLPVTMKEIRSFLPRFKSKELFRIYIKNLLVSNIESFSKNLNDLAVAIVQASLIISQRHVSALMGSSWPVNSRGHPYSFAVFALGKFGGQEMGFASDCNLFLQTFYLKDLVDVICVHDSNDDSESIVPSAFFSEFVRLFTRCMSDEVPKLGDAFEVDLRLRPYGSSSLEAVSFRKFKMYYTNSGGAQQFERQAMIRLRFVGGDEALGALVEAHRDEFVYSKERIDINVSFFVVMSVPEYERNLFD